MNLSEEESHQGGEKDGDEEFAHLDGLLDDFCVIWRVILMILLGDWEMLRLLMEVNGEVLMGS